MKKLLIYLFLFQFFCNFGFTESELPKCEGRNYDKWTNCQGTEEFENGMEYFGEFKDGKRHGLGTMKNPDGSKYIGQWKEGLPNGKGTETWEDGTKFIGEFKNGKKIGNWEGSIRYTN